MGELLDGFVPGLPPDLRTQILERAEGVPLYAVETVRMLLDRDLLARDGDVYRPTGPIEALDVPETLHALIAARLDGLSPDERGALQDAAVLGKSFTKPGLAALSGRDDATLDALLTSLVRKEVLSVQADPRSPERGQYSFLQDLLKRIAYDTLSKPERKTRHLAAAAHLERTITGAEGELVEVIAAHYLDAYEAAPDADDAATLRAKAGRAARPRRRAGSHPRGERGGGALFREGGGARRGRSRSRPSCSSRPGGAAFAGARWAARRSSCSTQAIGLYNDGRRRLTLAARVTARLGLTMWRDGDLRGGADRLAEALDVLADDEPDAAIADLIGTLGRLNYFLGEHRPRGASASTDRSRSPRRFPPRACWPTAQHEDLLLLSTGRYEEAIALLQHSIDPRARSRSRAFR